MSVRKLVLLFENGKNRLRLLIFVQLYLIEREFNQARMHAQFGSHTKNEMKKFNFFFDPAFKMCLALQYKNCATEMCLYFFRLDFSFGECTALQDWKTYVFFFSAIDSQSASVMMNSTQIYQCRCVDFQQKILKNAFHSVNGRRFPCMTFSNFFSIFKFYSGKSSTSL